MTLTNTVIQFTVTIPGVEIDTDGQTLQTVRQQLISHAEQLVYNKEYDSAVVVDAPSYAALRTE